MQAPAPALSAFEVGDEHCIVIITTLDLNCLELSACSLAD